MLHTNNGQSCIGNGCASSQSDNSRQVWKRRCRCANTLQSRQSWRRVGARGEDGLNLVQSRKSTRTVRLPMRASLYKPPHHDASSPIHLAEWPWIEKPHTHFTLHTSLLSDARRPAIPATLNSTYIPIVPRKVKQAKAVVAALSTRAPSVRPRRSGVRCMLLVVVVGCRCPCRRLA